MVTPRAARIKEEIEAVMKKGKKFEVKDAFKI